MRAGRAVCKRLLGGDGHGEVRYRKLGITSCRHLAGNLVAGAREEATAVPGSGAARDNPA